MPDAQCTRGLVCNCSGRTHTSNNEYTGITRHSRTQWFYGLCRALPGDRLSDSHIFEAQGGLRLRVVPNLIRRKSSNPRRITFGPGLP
jgi:hypothetical protein